MLCGLFRQICSRQRKISPLLSLTFRSLCVIPHCIAHSTSENVSQHVTSAYGDAARIGIGESKIDESIRQRLQRRLQVTQRVDKTAARDVARHRSYDRSDAAEKGLADTSEFTRHQLCRRGGCSDEWWCCRRYGGGYREQGRTSREEALCWTKGCRAQKSQSDRSERTRSAITLRTESVA